MGVDGCGETGEVLEVVVVDNDQLFIHRRLGLVSPHQGRRFGLVSPHQGRQHLDDLLQIPGLCLKAKFFEENRPQRMPHRHKRLRRVLARGHATQVR